MPLTILLALAATVPEVPVTHVQALQEGDVYVLRNLIDNNPLYTFDKDEPGKSNCRDDCATRWPPLWAPANAQPIGKWTLVKREDGSLQWAFEGRPVYSFARDPEPVPMGDGTSATWRPLPTFPAQ